MYKQLFFRLAIATASIALFVVACSSPKPGGDPGPPVGTSDPPRIVSFEVSPDATSRSTFTFSWHIEDDSGTNVRCVISSFGKHGTSKRESRAVGESDCIGTTTLTHSYTHYDAYSVTFAAWNETDTPYSGYTDPITVLVERPPPYDVEVGDTFNRPHTTQNIDISADGRLVVYTDLDIHLFERDKQDKRRVIQDGNAYSPKLSGNGRFIAFHTTRDHVANDTNRLNDVYVYDLQTRTLKRASVPEPGGQHQFTVDSRWAEISHDGRFVIFRQGTELFLRDMIEGVTKRVTARTVYDANLSSDGTQAVVMDSDYAIIVIDLVSGAETRVDVSPGGEAGNGESSLPVISADGRYVAFVSTATNLTNPSTTRATIFLRDMFEETTVAIIPQEVVAPGSFSNLSISGNGRFVAFESNVSDLVPNDTNLSVDVFLYDHADRLISRVSTRGEIEGNGRSWGPVLNHDGSHVLFQTQAANLKQDPNSRAAVILRRLTW